ncbi:LuxR family transcriptional regulator [Sphingobium phenoxybenzoativorans]|uniref:LuxR family transcriptional regulator n=1 Tax=Sphingobium phenoxybenzoativorans TaxID=1592790 RepID=A0A975K8Y7_9SPHN|nr:MULTISPECIES: LuxR family transcriptional regulator [Sphingobium]QUT05632.1 LuxR family transcriptional regulator [Sphingobium phenoxybenzoativorans]WDA39263.1 LuxR family transcriptional regulator [Sphingobium sp. YC-XJ3]
MSLHRLVEDYSRRCRDCATPAELFALTEAAAREIKFPRLAMVHGLSFRRPDRRLIRLDNFGEWADIFVERKYYRDDPALLACQRTNTAFAWTEMPRLLHLTHRQHLILGEAQRHGLSTGFTLPIGVMGEPHGCCSFARDGTELPSRWYCRAAALIGADAFREARRLHGYPARAKQLPQLSDRKFDCLELLAIGKTDPEIAIILGLQDSTVRSYMAQLRLDFDVYSRTQLTAEALRFGLVSYGDAIP